MTVANRMPKPRDTAICTTICACVDVSNMMGNRPKNVVSEVSRMARKRAAPDSTAACVGVAPRAAARLTKSTMMRLSFTTTPANARMPTSEMAVMGRSSNMWPSTAPMTPNGMALMMSNGCT